MGLAEREKWSKCLEMIDRCSKSKPAFEDQELMVEHMQRYPFALC